jgi:hypothetical protein
MQTLEKSQAGYEAGLKDYVDREARGRGPDQLRRSIDVRPWRGTGVLPEPPAGHQHLSEVIKLFNYAEQVVNKPDRRLHHRRSGRVNCWTLTSRQARSISAS